MHDFPFCVPVGSQAPHATGVAYALKLRKEPRVAVCLSGDGATSKGDVYEAMNFAGVHKLPAVFVVNNNQWAISVPLRLQTACQTLAQKAIAAGFDGEQVDGNDAIAVRAAADVDHPLLLGEPRQIRSERGRICQATALAEEPQLTAVTQLHKTGEKQAAEQCRQHPHRNEELGSAANPPLPVRRDAAARHDAMHVGMVIEV